MKHHIMISYDSILILHIDIIATETDAGTPMMLELICHTFLMQIDTLLSPSYKKKLAR